MKELVVPFRGERYAETDKLSRLIAPPYDVIDAAARARFAALDEHNIVHLMLPEAPSGGDRYAWAGAQLASWRRRGVLARDTDPTVYVMAQGDRLGVFVALAAEGYEPRRVRPHEKTHAGPKADRLALLRATRTNLESIFLLAPDPDRALANALAEIAKRPPPRTRPPSWLESVSVCGECVVKTFPGSPFPMLRCTSPTVTTATRRRAPTRPGIPPRIACSHSSRRRGTRGSSCCRRIA